MLMRKPQVDCVALEYTQVLQLRVATFPAVPCTPPSGAHNYF